MYSKTYDSADDVAQAAAADTIDILARAIDDRGSAVWALAGGSTPNEAYKIINDRYADALDWSEVIFIIGDERCVPYDHADSNWGTIRTLLTDLKISNEQVLLPPSITGPKTAAVELERLLSDKLSIDISDRVFDCTWLGVGEDGHTLSLFPRHDDTLNSERYATFELDSPKPPSERITLTIPAVKKSRNVFVLITGNSKADSYKRILDHDHSAPISQVFDALDNSNRLIYTDIKD